MTKVRKLGNKILFLTAAIVWSACSDLVREDILSDKGCTLTVNAIKNETTNTRVLNPDGNKIIATWNESDRVTVLSANNSVIGTMAPINIEGNKAKLKATLTSPVKKGDQLTLVFPRSGRDYTGQKGTLADIAANYDYANAQVVVQYAEDSFVSATDAIFTNQQAIVKFNLTNTKAQPINASDLTITADGLIQKGESTGPITITPTNATNEIYAALSGLHGVVTLTAAVDNKTYSYVSTEVKKLENSGFYRFNVKMQAPTVAYTEPLTFECYDRNGGYISVKDFVDLEYCRNGGDWLPARNQINIKSGDRISFRGTESTRGTSSDKYMQINCNADCYIYGNVMSLLSKDNYATMTELPYSNTFQNLFRENTHITHANGKDLVLPATTLKKQCYYNMFYGCSKLNYIKCLATDISAQNCTTNWLAKAGTAISGTHIFVKAAGFEGWPTNSNSGIPDRWTVEEE